SPSEHLLVPLHEAGADAELVPRQAEGLAGDVLGDAVELVEDATGADDRHPVVGRALALAHSGLEGLLRERLVGEDADPDLATALDVAGHGDTRRLDLPRRDVSAGGRLQPEVAEGHVGAAVREAAHLTFLHLAVLDTLGRKHRLLLNSWGTVVGGRRHRRAVGFGSCGEWPAARG